MANDTSPTRSLSAVLHGPKDLRIEERPCAPPGPGEVQVRVKATGLCGSDLHYYNYGRNGDFALQHPMCLGHESAGEIVAVGSGVPHEQFAVGDRVAIEAGVYCKACPRCKEGRYNLCASMRFASSAKTHPHLDGTLQQYMNWPYWGVHALPESVSLESAALIEPLSVVLQGLRRSNLRAGESVLVLGAGAVGLLACAAAKASGASFVAAVDIDEGRLKFARDNGWADATHLLPRAPLAATEDSKPPSGDARARRAAEDSAVIALAKQSAASLMDALFPLPSNGQARDRVREMQREGFDAVFECSGVPSCVQMGIFATRPGGRVVLIGMGNPIQTLPIGAAALREVDILGVFRYAGTYPTAIGMLSGDSLRARGGGVSAAGPAALNGSHAPAGLVTEGTGVGRRMGGIENVISHRYPLAQARDAFETLARGNSADGRGVTKVFIVD
ncbi:unnamed protein product [Parajaminaea phylloscopi]